MRILQPRLRVFSAALELSQLTRHIFVRSQIKLGAAGGNRNLYSGLENRRVANNTSTASGADDWPRTSYLFITNEVLRLMSFVSIGAAIRKCTGLSCLRNRRFAIKALAAWSPCPDLRRIPLLTGQTHHCKCFMGIDYWCGSRELNSILFHGKELCSRKHLYRIGGSEENRTLVPCLQSKCPPIERRTQLITTQAPTQIGVTDGI